MENKILVKNVDNYRLIGIGPSGHSVIMDSSYQNGTNSAASPMELILHALAGCTGIDVLSIMNKMKVKYSTFEIEITYKNSVEHPKVYTDINLIYRMKADEGYRANITKAIELSENKYCSVSAMLKRAGVNLSYDIELI